MITVERLTGAHLVAMGIEEHIDKIEPPNRGYVMLKDDKPIACGGVLIPSLRVACVWTKIDSCRHSVYLMRRIHYAARYLLDQLKTDFDRIQADTLYADKQACYWPRRFGFHYEGKMHRYYQDQTYLRFAWTRKD